jgi:hypothetical protein
MSYGSKDILGLKLRGAAYLRRLTRNELFTRLQLVRALDPLTDDVYRRVEEKRHRDQSDDENLALPWHVSFHASQFPGDDPQACPRKALYTLMDFAREAGDRKARNLPFDRASRTIMSAGKAVELELVQTYADAGILLSAKPGEPQTMFVWKDAWMTGTVDCVIRWLDTTLVVPVEIKTKYQAVIDRMKLGARGPDANHVAQLKAQLGLIHHAMQAQSVWSDLTSPTHGYLFYLSRDRPSDTAEFRIDLDLRFFEAGINRLKQWKQWFVDDVLPEESKGRRTNNFGHPMGASDFKWSHLPCQFCDFKRTCQLDYRQNIHRLSESVGIDRTRVYRETYDPDETRNRVFATWGEKR